MDYAKNMALQAASAVDPYSNSKFTSLPQAGLIGMAKGQAMPSTASGYDNFSQLEDMYKDLVSKFTSLQNELADMAYRLFGAADCPYGEKIASVDDGNWVSRMKGNYFRLCDIQANFGNMLAQFRNG